MKYLTSKDEYLKYSYLKKNSFFQIIVYHCNYFFVFEISNFYFLKL